MIGHSEDCLCNQGEYIWASPEELQAYSKAMAKVAVDFIFRPTPMLGLLTAKPDDER